MIRIIIIFILALIPTLLSFEMIRQTKRRFQARVRRIRADTVPEVVVSDFLEPLQEQPLFIGDISCRYNARSSYLRCATNPSGPCEGCLHYESRV